MASWVSSEDGLATLEDGTQNCVLFESEICNRHLFEEYCQYKNIDECQDNRTVGRRPAQFLIAEICVAIAESDADIHRLFPLHDGHRLLLGLALLIVREIIAGTTSEHWVLVVVLSLVKKVHVS